MEIQHFLHRHHPLKLYEKTDFETVCYGCDNLISSHQVTYGCSDCDFFLHETCAKLPQLLQHFFHPCPLFLNILTYTCNGCHRFRSQCFTYRCEKCDFDLDLGCARIPKIKAEGEEEIQHYTHRHPMVMLSKMGKQSKKKKKKGKMGSNNNQVSCKICGKLCLNHSYGCRNCEFYLHKSCMEMLPQTIQVFYHPCQLVLLTIPFFYCDACENKYLGLCFRCGKCYFQLCVDCFLSIAAKKPKDKQITHFSHRHPLILLENVKDHESSCSICRKHCLTTTYGCQECSLYFHKSCLDILPPEIQLFFHPCSLISLSTSSYTCDTCWKPYSGVYFRCGACRFKLCVDCSIMPRSSIDEDDKEWFQHFSHHHPLVLSENMVDYGEVSCGICGKISLNSIFRCSQCKSYFHQTCLDMLPQKIDKHFFHSCPHSCSLILLSTPSYKCHGCDQRYAGLTFRCGRCQFHLCIECSLLPTIQLGACEKIQHFLHEHPLILSEKKVSDVCCNACGNPCLGPTYGCSRCKLFLHKSCAELPQKIKIFSHFSHPLILASQNSREGRRAMSKKKSKKARCCLCFKDCCDFAFCCNKCNLQLDVECALLKPTIDYPGHNHLLTVVDKIYGSLECNFCKTCCKDSPAFRCLECNFSLHLLCGPLPCTIKHECHIDTLTLKDQYVEDDDDDDDFYCDACERRRDPRLCVYYCALGCPMIVEVKCVISEVLATLKGKHGDVELRVVGRYITSKMVTSKDLAAEEIEQNEIDNSARELKDAQSKAALSLDDILISLDAVERRQLDNIEAIMRREVEASILSLENKDDTKTFAYYSEEAFKRFMEVLDSAILEMEIPNFILEHEEFISFQDYLVPRTLIPTFQDLLGKNEDICDGSILSLRVKSLILYFLCGVIENMRATRIMDLTNQRLGEWFACLKWVKYAGFKFRFISEHMEHVARAHFVVQTRKFVSESPAQLQQEIKKICQEIKKLKTVLTTVEKKQEINNRHVKAARSSLSKRFSNVPLSIKWKPAADGLL